MTKLKRENRQDKQAIHQVEYFLRFTYFVAGIQKTKKGQIREPLRCCAQLRVDQKLETIATERHDAKLIALASDDLVAKEALYHPSCYKVYTKPVKPLMGKNDTFKIDALRSTIDELLASCEVHITFINDVKKTYLKNLEAEGVETKKATKFNC